MIFGFQNPDKYGLDLNTFWINMIFNFYFPVIYTGWKNIVREIMISLYTFPIVVVLHALYAYWWRIKRRSKKDHVEVANSLLKNVEYHVTSDTNFRVVTSELSEVDFNFVSPGLCFVINDSDCKTIRQLFTRLPSTAADPSFHLQSRRSYI